MTQSDKDLLLKDLCARLSYGVKVLYDTQIFEVQYIEPMYEELKLLDNETYTLPIEEVKPYLFPISSMTEEQLKEYMTIPSGYRTIDWFNKNHFDYRCLIENGLAIDATGKNIY